MVAPRAWSPCLRSRTQVCVVFVYDLFRCPNKVIAQPGGYFMAPVEEERIGDVSNVLFSNGWITDEDGTVYIYYASSDTRMHVATSTIERLIDYCLHTPEDKLRSATSVDNIYQSDRSQ